MLQPSLNRETAHDFHTLKALADASARPEDRRVCISPFLLAWVALELLALKWNCGWKGLGWATPAQTGCGWSQKDPPTPHLSSSQFWHSARAARPALPCAHTRGAGKSEQGQHPWLVAARTGPQRPCPAGTRASRTGCQGPQSPGPAP